MPQPNFFIIGAPRSGTSSLYDGLRQHPDIFMSPVKEPWFYSTGERCEPFKGPRDANYYLYLSREQYENLFSGVSGEMIIGEASTDYLYSERALERIHREHPTAKLVAILRNPVERAYSHFIQHRRQGREPLENFQEAWEAEEERMRWGWSHYWFYRSMGFYGQQLQRYFERFDRNRLKVVFLDDLQKAPDLVYRELFRFLNVDDSFLPHSTHDKHNAAQIPKNRFLQNLITKPSPLRPLVRCILPRRLRSKILVRILRHRQKVEPPPLDPQLRIELAKHYFEDLGLLETLVHRDLSAWTVGPTAASTRNGT